MTQLRNIETGVSRINWRAVLRRHLMTMSVYSGVQSLDAVEEEVRLARRAFIRT